MHKVLVTGGSGFIGTNLVDALLTDGSSVVSVDATQPRNREHLPVFRHTDLLDRGAFSSLLDEFKPTYVIHLAAKTDFHGASLRDYEINFSGVESLIEAIGACDSVERCLFTSTKLVCRTGCKPHSCEDYDPDTVYGESKVRGEQIIRASTLPCSWAILRPTSIWGPWFDVPYKRFFLAVAKGLYVHPGASDPRKSYGYVGNTVFQIMSLLNAARDEVHGKTFYLSDYEEYTIREWADAISMDLRGRTARTIPEPLMRVAAWSGDCLQRLGYRNPPMTSFRLRNMQADTTTGVSLDATRQVTGPLPHSMESGVRETVHWLRKQHLIA